MPKKKKIISNKSWTKTVTKTKKYKREMKLPDIYHDDNSISLGNQNKNNWNPA